MNNKDTFVVQGLAGKRTLKGTVMINGAKNSALKAMAAAILFDGPVTLENVPETSDIKTLGTILTKLGAGVEVVSQQRTNGGGQTLKINPTSITSTDIDKDLAKGMRGSVVLTGPMLARYKKVLFPAPGGCVIGARPIDLFLSAYEKLGATVTEKDCVYDIEGNELSGTEITFSKISVGATETVMMAAVLLKGRTVLNNCACEPEIVNVAEWLNACGAKISGVGSSTITIEGTAGVLLSPKIPFVTIPDRITAGSYLILGALCAEELTIQNCRPDHLEETMKLLADSGVHMKVGKGSITVYGARGSMYKSLNEVRTKEYPGFPTDLQSPMTVFLTQCEGESTVIETIFEGRFKYIEDLTKLGASITLINPHEVKVQGPTLFHQLSGNEELTAHDIRAGFAVVLAALIAEGKSVVTNVHLIDRGYEQIEVVLNSLGAKVERVKG